MVVKSFPTLAGNLNAVGPWNVPFARRGSRVYPYQFGAMVRTTETDTALNVEGIGDFAVSDYALYCTAQSFGDTLLFTPDTDRIRLVSAVDATLNTITVSPSLSVVQGDYLFNLGADSGGLTPAYDASDVSLYDDPQQSNANANGYVTVGAEGQFVGWTNDGLNAVALLVTNSSGQPTSVIPWFALIPTQSAAQHFFGNGSPEGAVTAGVGSLYSRLNGGNGTSLYVKTSGTGNTGWRAVNDSAP